MKMFINLTLLLTFIIVVINGSIPSSMIETDVKELSRLHKEFIDLSPSTSVNEVYKLRCDAVNACCPAERENLFTMFSESQFNNKCLGNGTTMTRLPRSSPCIPIIHQLVQLTKDPIYNQYFELLGNHVNRLNRIKIWKNQMKAACVNDELQAYYCERNNIEKFTSCQRKVLEKFAQEHNDDDGTMYKTYVSQWEQEYAIDNQKLSKAFPKKV